MIGKPHNMFRAFVVVIPLCAAIVCSSFAQDGYGVGQPYPNHNPAAGFLPPYENSTANQSGVQAPGHQSAINRLPPGAPYYPPLPPAVPQYDSRSATPTVTIRQLPNTPPLPHTPGVAELNTSSDAAELAHQAVDGASSWFSPTEWIQPVEWEGSIEVGINAAAGNSESLSMTTGFDLKRTTDLYEMATDLKYAKISNSGVETQHNALYNASIERFYGDTPWTTFGKLFLEYDEFKAFDMRIALNGGIGYKLWETDVSKFVTRFGAGVSHEIDGPDDSWVPEALFGADYEWQMTERQKFVAKFDYFPEWANFRDYRFVSNVGWEVQLDCDPNLSLKLNITDRYDSTPNGLQPNDINYSLLLIWKL